VLNIAFFFFQAEDGIRDRNVTGVQTCGSSDLEFFGLHARIAPPENRSLMLPASASHTHILAPHGAARRSPSGLIPNDRESTRTRSEERRVGKECRRRRSGEPRREVDINRG